MTTYLFIFRTHVWDENIAAVASQARRCAASAAFLVAADESRGPMDVAPFFKLPYTADFGKFGLPLTPVGRVLWWNADYALYLIRDQLPGFDFYVMSEYDVFVDQDIDDMIHRCSRESIDLVFHGCAPTTPGSHWAHATIEGAAPASYHAFIPFLIVSARAVDELLSARQALARRFHEGEISAWPYCEAFIPTFALTLGLKTAEVSEFTDASLLRFRPFLSVKDQRLKRGNLIAHPVVGGRRFVAAFASDGPPGSHVMTDGFPRRELEAEDLGDIRGVFGQDIVHYPGTAEPATAAPGLTDVARDKPATMSSGSRWLQGRKKEDDASQANSGALRADCAFHTDHEDSPWWRVDLQGIYTVYEVELLNRPGFELRFLHFAIDISLDGETWSTAFAKEDNAFVSSEEQRPARFQLAGRPRARYLRIVLSGEGVLHLRRVRVMGLPDADPTTSAPIPSTD
jgi:hypothetical protein